MEDLHKVEGYLSCADCGRLVLADFGYQTGQRCADCWGEKHPLADLMIANDGAAIRFRRNPKKERSVGHPKKSLSPKKRGGRKPAAVYAEEAAVRRLKKIHRDLYTMLFDEERVKRGLPPIARYNPIDFDEIVCKTFDYHEVYDALRSSGETDA